MQYQFGRELGSGAMGTVFEAKNQNGTTCAVKVLHEHLAADEGILSRFQREARAASLLDHPHIVKVADFGTLDDKRHFIEMEYLDGENLEVVLNAQRILPIQWVLEIGIAVARALEEAHQHEVVHRDLKPANIVLLGKRESPLLVKVCDFGIAKITSSLRDSYQTMAGVVCGTPEYVAPEQARGLPVDGRADLYSLGILLFELLAGRPPFTGNNALELLNQHIRVTPPALKDFRPEVPEALARLIEGLLAKAPQERPSSAGEVATALESLLRAQDASAFELAWQETGTLEFPSVDLSSVDEESVPNPEVALPVASSYEATSSIQTADFRGPEEAAQEVQSRLLRTSVPVEETYDAEEDSSHLATILAVIFITTLLYVLFELFF